MGDLIQFLRQRNVPEETIEKLEQEKIDVSVILLMTDEQLKTYLPSYGDRLAVLGFCRRQEDCPQTRKSKLFDRLKSKLSKKQRTEEYGKGSTQKLVTKNAEKSVRKIELGWMHYDDEEKVLKQVRTRKGGGTRKIDVSKDSSKADLIKEATCLFFPNGKNVKGNTTEFEFDLKDYQEMSVDESATVGKLYEDTKLPLLRFYLATKTKNSTQNQGNANVEFSEENLSFQDFESSTPIIEQSSHTSQNADVPDVIYIGNERDTSSTQSISFLHSTEVVSTEPFTLDLLEDSNVVTFVTDNHRGITEQSMDDTLPMSPESQKTPRILVVHRGNVLLELISHFSDESILSKNVKIQLVLPDGHFEMGHDDGGVVRDCLSEFWHDFYDQCTMGSSLKVPFLRHDFGQAQWESVGRIIAFGWRKEKYLPVRLAPVILEQAASGYIKSDLIENFLKFVPEGDQAVFESWRSDFDSVDKDELLEILDNYLCRKGPTANNFGDILQELAHKKLLQEPAYVIDQWATTLSTAGLEIEQILTTYEYLLPTSRKVVKSLSFPEALNTQEKDIQRYVTTYVRESDPQRLSLFLRFCTGSDLFLGKIISIIFTQIKGFQRRLIAHTCGCVLELSLHYDSYLDFRSEINKVLESNVWVMDIV